MYGTGASNGGYYESSTSTFTAAAWNHYAVVVAANGAITYYKNGTAEAGSTASVMPPASVTRDVNYVGRRQGTSALQYWKGGLDEVAIYAAPLAAARIQAHAGAASATAYGTRC